MADQQGSREARYDDLPFAVGDGGVTFGTDDDVKESDQKGHEVGDDQKAQTVFDDWAPFDACPPSAREGIYSPGQFFSYNGDVEDEEFGRNVNRNEFFSVTTWDLNRDKNPFRPASSNGGGRIRQIPTGVSSNNHGEVFVVRVEPETGSCSTTDFYATDPSAEVIALKQKVSEMQKEQDAREEEWRTQLEVERKRVADLQAQQIELAAKMVEQDRLSEQISAFMLKYSSELPPRSPPSSS